MVLGENKVLSIYDLTNQNVLCKLIHYLSTHGTKVIKRNLEIIPMNLWNKIDPLSYIFVVTKRAIWKILKLGHFYSTFTYQ